MQFQDGEPFDAAAVKYSLERHADMPGSFRRSEIGAMDHVEVVDPLTVRVVLKQPFSPFVAVLTDRAGMMVAPKAAEAAGKDFGLHPVCAGPFSFVERVAQDRIVLERFPGYWDAGRIHYDRVTYQVIPDSSIRLANLKAGALDIAEVAPLDVAGRQGRSRSSAVVSVPSLGYGALTINLAGTIERWRRTRACGMAFELSLDRAALCQVVFAGHVCAERAGDLGGQPVLRAGRADAAARRGRGAGAAAGGRRHHAAAGRAAGLQHAAGRAGRRGDPGDGGRGGVRRAGESPPSSGPCSPRPRAATSR